jgi:hypothetical protein
MSWEALSAVSSLLTAIVIAITAVIAFVQIRHLRRAAQLQSFLELMSEATGPSMSSWTAYVETQLPEKMKDETYRRELSEGHYDFENHKELALGAFWEKIGALIHNRLIEPDVFLDFAGATCPYHWELLREVTALRRQSNSRAWERFEELALMCKAYIPS